jgi:hypothetical protein
MRHTSSAPNRDSSIPRRFCHPSPSAKTRSPAVQRTRLPALIIQPAKTSTGFSREFSSAISGFRSLCGRKQRSSFSHRAQLDLRFGTFHSGRALVLRTLAFTRSIYGGPATLDRCCRWNVVAPGEYSKGFFCIPIGLYEGNFRPATARWIPARSALGGLSHVNPAAVINRSTSVLWPCPASTTSTPPGTSRPAACGMSAR